MLTKGQRLVVKDSRLLDSFLRVVVMADTRRSWEVHFQTRMENRVRSPGGFEGIEWSEVMVDTLCG